MYVQYTLYYMYVYVILDLRVDMDCVRAQVLANFRVIIDYISLEFIYYFL